MAWCQLGKAAHPTVTSMGTWGSKCQLSMSCIVGEDPDRTSGAHPSPVEHGSASCGLLFLPQEDLPALTHNI